MYTRPRSIVLLICVLLAATALTALMSGSTLAHFTFQSSPVLPPRQTQVLPSATVTAAQLPTETPAAGGLGSQADLPTIIPTQPPAKSVESTAPPGFLPAPTLTNPGALLPSSAIVQPPLVGPAAPPVDPTPAPNPTASGAPSAAQLIDNGIVAFSYLWLCCGAVLLGAVALVVVWLARRGVRR